MASMDPDEPFNTETDEETIALRKKRLRRVSFADREITSVHIFKRDEDYETPPDSSARKPSSAEEDNEVLGFFRDLAPESDESREMSLGDDDDEVVTRNSFLRPIESPSPQSGTIGSATSNDEDNFFGPVSASFIRPRLSDSAASDDNHDVTMDSTAFSMHFRSLVRSESGDLKTPTGFHSAFEEKTPSQVATPSDPRSFMILTKAKKPNAQTPPAISKVSGCRDSNDMSLVGENSHRYDYGRLSPRLEALLAEGSERMHAASLFDFASNTESLKKNEVPILNDNTSCSMDRKDNRDSAMCNVGPDDMYTEGLPMVYSISDEVNGGSKSNINNQISHDCPSNTNDLVAGACADHHIQSPNQPNKVNKAFIEAETGISMLNVEFPVGSGDIPPDVNENSVHRFGFFPQHEPADLSSTEKLLKESLPTDGTHNPHIDQLRDQQSGSPLSGSIILDTTNSSKHLSYVTPSLKQPGTFLRKENIKVGESVSSIQKSHSKFEYNGSSACTYALRDAIEKSKRRLSEYLSFETSPVNNVVKETAKDLQCQHVDASVMNLEKHLVSADRMNEEHKITPEMDGYSYETPKNFGSLNQNEETTGLVKDEESLDHLSDLIPSEDKLTETMAAMTSPTQLTFPRKIQHLLISNNLLQGALGASGSDTTSVEVAFDHRKDQETTNDSDKFASLPTKSLDQTLSSLAESQANLSGHSKHQVQYKNLVIDSGLDGNLIQNVTRGSHLTSMAEKLDSIPVDWRTQSSSPLLENNHVKDFTQGKSVDDREIYSSILQKASEIIKNFHTFSRDLDLEKFQMSSPNKNLKIANDPFLTKDGYPGDGIRASPCALASPYVKKIVNEPSLLKSPSKEPTWSPSRKEQADSSLRDHTHLFVSQGGLSSKSSSDEHCNDDCCQEPGNSQSPFPLQGFDNSLRRKRRNEEKVLGDADNAYNINRIQRSPKVYKSGGGYLELLLERSNESEKGDKNIGDEATLKQWTDILQKFTAETNQILSPLIEKLNRRTIGVLEDNLVRLQKVNKYEMLCSEILSQVQKIYDQSSNIRHKRLAEIRLLLYKIVYGKAMLQILCMKHEKLLKRRQLLKSGIQKFQILKLNYVRHLSAPVKRDTQVDDNLHDASLTKFGSKRECQVASDNVTTMRQEVESFESKTKNLVKSFLTYCNMKGELSCDNAITLLNDHLKKRMRRRSIQKDLQLWEIDDLETSNANHSLVLNYCGFICQRFTNKAHPSSMVISNKLNNIKIMKKFPNMEAHVAFAFVFNAESTKKSVGFMSLAQETQTISSLLHNLLDVVEEVRLARLENRNLIQTSFISPSAEKLSLRLSFVDFNSGRKVTMALDMTCLNRGVYPLEILPYQLEVSTARMQKSLPESLSSAIKAAVANLTIGFSRIIRLCNCVSQVVELSSR